MRLIAATASLAILAASAEAAPDRSALSLDENVAINAICAPARSKGGGAFEACVGKQVRSLAAHPSPDRSGLSAERNRVVERACEHFRRVEIGAWNDCLRRAIETAERAPEAPKSDDGFGPNLAKVFAPAMDKPKPQPATPAALPLPAKALPGRPPAGAKGDLLPAELYKKVERSVWVVLAAPSAADARSRNVAQGSAVAVTDTLLLTNCHVVEGRPLIRLLHAELTADATLVAAHPATDRCVLRAEGLKLSPVAGIRGFDGLAVGERVFAVGSPRSLERTMSEGLVSGLRRQRGRNLVQTSAPVSPGSSGGGLFDAAGNLVGITTFLVVGAQNLNFAVAATDFWE